MVNATVNQYWSCADNIGSNWSNYIVRRKNKFSSFSPIPAAQSSTIKQFVPPAATKANYIFNPNI